MHPDQTPDPTDEPDTHALPAFTLVPLPDGTYGAAYNLDVLDVRGGSYYDVTNFVSNDRGGRLVTKQSRADRVCAETVDAELVAERNEYTDRWTILKCKYMLRPDDMIVVFADGTVKVGQLS